MKKIVFVCDGNNFSKEAFRFVQSFYENEPFLLTGAFFHSLNYGLLIPNTFAPGAGPYLSYTHEENEDYYKGIARFRNLCEKNNIEYRVHQEGDTWEIKDLVKESRFADLLVVDARLFFSNVPKSEARHTLQQTLHWAECPVVVIPDQVEPIDEIVIAYDGKRDSMNAIKSFTYLFPHFCNLETTIIYLNQDPEKEIPELPYIQEFGARHFELLTFEHLNLSPKSFAFWVKAHKNALLVTGAYNRSGVSMTLNKSFAEEIIHAHSLPVFISHC